MAAASKNSASRPWFCCPLGLLSREWTGLPGLRARDRMLPQRPAIDRTARDWGPGWARHSAFRSRCACRPRTKSPTVDGCVKDTKAYLGKAVRDAPPPPRGAGRLAPLLWRRGLLRWNNTTLVGPGQKRRVVIIEGGAFRAAALIRIIRAKRRTTGGLVGAFL